MSEFAAVDKLIADNPSVARFAPRGNGVSDEWILTRESELGAKFPPSYRWWLKTYKGGEIGGEEIYSIYEFPMDSRLAGDIVHATARWRDRGFLNESQVAVCQSDIDGAFFFEIQPDEEWPVIWQGNYEVYAADFAEFLRMRIELMIE